MANYNPEESYIDLQFMEDISGAQYEKDDLLIELHKAALNSVSQFLGITATFFKGRLRSTRF